jgi:hypothetical protein
MGFRAPSDPQLRAALITYKKHIVAQQWALAALIVARFWSFVRTLLHEL